MLSAIVAIGLNNVIGKDNSLLWQIPEDLKYFKEKTIYSTVIMGRKTYESIGGVLKNRENIVITRDKNFKSTDEIKVINSLEELQLYIREKKENFVIGGGEIYKLLMPYINKLYVTKIYHNFNGDVYFPDVDLESWKEVWRKKGIKNEQNPYDYDFFIYQR